MDGDFHTIQELYNKSNPKKVPPNHAIYTKAISLIIVCTLIILLQCLFLLSIYESKCLGDFNPLRCHVESSSIEIKMNVAIVDTYWITLNVTSKDGSAEFKEQQISLQKVKEMITNQQLLYSVPLYFITDFNTFFVNDTLYSSESVTCYTRDGDSKIYIEKTSMYDTMCSLFWIIIFVDIFIIFLPFVAYILYQVRKNKRRSLMLMDQYIKKGDDSLLPKWIHF